MKTIVKLHDGTTREFVAANRNEWYRGEIEGKGCLTIYRIWDGGVCCGKTSVTSFAEGRWLEWLTVPQEPTS